MKSKINVSDIIHQLQKIDYSLLFENIKLIIIGYIADKNIKTYKLYKDFKSKDVSVVELPPEIMKKNSEIDKRRLLQQKFGDSIVSFATTIISKIPNVNLMLFYNNISSLTTSIINFRSINFLLKGNVQGAYIPNDNNIELQENNYTLTIDHELFHMASTFYRKSDGMCFSGFMQKPNDKKRIANGINEGYTQLLTERYFGEDKTIMKSYQYEKSVVEKLEMIIGKEKMESLYFNANLYELIKELKQYEDDDTIMQFFTDIDFLGEHLMKKQLSLTMKNMIIAKLKSTNLFLLRCYLKKLKINSDRLDNEAISSNFEIFIKMMGTTEKIGKSKYVFTDENEIMDTMNKVLTNLKNNDQQQNQQSILK